MSAVSVAVAVGIVAVVVNVVAAVVVLTLTIRHNLVRGRKTGSNNSRGGGTIIGVRFRPCLAPSPTPFPIPVGIISRSYPTAVLCIARSWVSGSGG